MGHAELSDQTSLHNSVGGMPLTPSVVLLRCYTSTIHKLQWRMHTRIWSIVLSSEQVGQDMEALNSVAFNGLSPSRVWSHLVEDFDIHSWSGRGRGHATIYSTRCTHQCTLLARIAWSWTYAEARPTSPQRRRKYWNEASSG